MSKKSRAVGKVHYTIEDHDRPGTRYVTVTRSTVPYDEKTAVTLLIPCDLVLDYALEAIKERVNRYIYWLVDR